MFLFLFSNLVYVFQIFSLLIEINRTKLVRTLLIRLRYVTLTTFTHFIQPGVMFIQVKPVFCDTKFELGDSRFDIPNTRSIGKSRQRK